MKMGVSMLNFERFTLNLTITITRLWDPKVPRSMTIIILRLCLYTVIYHKKYISTLADVELYSLNKSIKHLEELHTTLVSSNSCYCYFMYKMSDLHIVAA